MKYLQITFIALLGFMFTGCSQTEKHIANEADYQHYLTFTSNTALKECDATLQFWQARCDKRAGTTEQIMLGGMYAQRFKVSGNIENLHTADSLFELAHAKQPSMVGVYHALAANAITQHQFKKAKNYIEQAIALGEKKSSSLLMLADINLELGDLYGAKYILKDFKNKNSFPWLIREAKVKDHEGNLDSAIVLMEQALDKVKSDDDLYCWTKTNLGDFYGHAGRVAESYQCYLDVLKKNPDYQYALKQIAWIAFSHDHNPEAAKKIISHLMQSQNIPDFYLFLANIAVYENDKQEAASNFHKFITTTASEEYGEMYNKYLVNLNTNNLNNAEAALLISRREIKNRPTPQSYDLLAWSYLNAGQKQKALALVENYVEGKTFEPDAIYHMGMIFKANDQQEKGEALLKEALVSEFELGPLVSQAIRQQLRKSS